KGEPENRDNCSPHPNRMAVRGSEEPNFCSLRILIDVEQRNFSEILPFVSNQKDIDGTVNPRSPCRKLHGRVRVHRTPMEGLSIGLDYPTETLLWTSSIVYQANRQSNHPLS